MCKLQTLILKLWGKKKTLKKCWKERGWIHWYWLLKDWNGNSSSSWDNSLDYHNALLDQEFPFSLFFFFPLNSPYICLTLYLYLYLMEIIFIVQQIINLNCWLGFFKILSFLDIVEQVVVKRFVNDKRQGLVFTG